MIRGQRPRKQGLYDPIYEHDACGVGFVARIDGTRSHAVLRQSEEIRRSRIPVLRMIQSSDVSTIRSSSSLVSTRSGAAEPVPAIWA